MTIKSKLTDALRNVLAELETGEIELDKVAQLQLVLGEFTAELRHVELRKQYDAALQVARAMGCATLAEMEQRITNPGQPLVPKRVIKPLYRDPANPNNTWAGRGKPPRWMQAKLDAGAQVSDFRITE